MPNYKREVPRTPKPDGTSIVRIYTNSDGNLVFVYAGGNITVITGTGGGGGGSPGSGLDGGFADGTDTTIEIDAHDAAYNGTNSTNSGGAYNTL